MKSTSQSAVRPYRLDTQAPLQVYPIGANLDAFHKEKGNALPAMHCHMMQLRSCVARRCTTEILSKEHV